MRKQRIISVLLTLCMVFSLLPVSALAASVEDFTDVSKGSWYYADVDFVADNGYFKGMSETTFAPDETMTRAMFVTVLSRFARAKVDDSKTSFTDVPTGTWYTGAVTWAAERKIVEGRGNGIFDPNGSVTREEMCTIIDRYLEATGTDVRDNVKHDQLKDEDQVSAWARDAVDNCQSYGVIYGYPDGTFQPKATATRAHVAAILHRLQIIVRGGGGGGSGNSGEDPIYYTITLEAAPAAGGKVEGPEGKTSFSVKKNDTVTLKATANDGYEFVKWYWVNEGTEYLLSTDAVYAHEAVGSKTIYAQFKLKGAEVQDLTYQAASNLTTYLNGNVGGDGADIYFPTEEIAYISAIALSDAYVAEGTKTADVSITGRATLTTELVREVYTEAIAEAHVLYDILRAELDGATDTKAQLVAELKAVAKDVFAAVGYEPDAATLNAIAEEIYAKVVSLYREIANKTLGKDDLNKSGLTTTINTYKEVKALTKQELNAVREAVRTAVKTYNGDYAFDTAVISVDGTDLFSIDVSKGFVLNYADNFKNSSIDLPDGKKAFVKETAVALAHQMRASNPKTDWTNTVNFNGHVTMTLGIKDAVANSPAYDCTEVFELGCSLSVTDQTNTVMYKYDGVKDYIKITIPDKVEKEYNEKVPTIWNKVIDYVMDNPDVLDRFSGKAGEPAVATFALKRSTSGLNFDIDEIMANADKYLTPDATLGLVNGNDEDVLEMMDKAVGDMVTPEDVDKMLADNEDIDFNLEDLVNDLSTEGTLTEKEKEDLKEKIVEVAADAIEEAVKGTEYEKVIDRDLAVYVATSATNQVVTKKAEEMAAAAETEKAEAEAELAEAAEGEALTQQQIDRLMKDLAEAQENNASQAEIEALNKEIETKEAEKAEYAAAAGQAQEKISAAAATAERLQSANTVFADNLASAKDNAVNSGSVGTFVEEIKKNDTVGSAINQVENNRTLQELIKLYAKVDTYDEVCAVKLSVIADALQTERFDDLGNGIVEKVQEWLNQYNLNIPASASLKIGRYSIDNELLQAVRSASTTGELREAVAELFDAMGGLSINAFAEGLDVTVNAGGYSYTVNVTIVK